MRHLNAIITILIMVLFLVHMIWGGLLLIGAASTGGFFLVISFAMVILIILHVIISIKLTLNTIMACKISGVSYWRENKIFWLRRISGIAVMIFILSHILIFMGRNVDGVFVLNVFNVMALISQLLLVISLLLHITTNINPLRIALGLRDEGGFRTDMILILQILLVLAGISFVIYFIRWL